MSNRFVVTISDFPITGVSHPTAEEAGRKEGDGESHPFYSVAELVPVKEIEELRSSAAGEKLLAAQIGERGRQADKDSDEIVALMAQVGNLEANRAHKTDLPGDIMSENRFAVVDKKSNGVCPRSFQTAAEAKDANPPYDHFAAELVPVKEIEELRELATSKKNYLTALCVTKDERIHFLENELRLADEQLERFAGVGKATRQLHEQRLWEAYLSLEGQEFDSDGMRMLAAEGAVEFFEDRHGHETDKPWSDYGPSTA